ncbi:unnamed protein product [Phyllotreta striolata]|uniref:SET domain-containing protein n=1 Tax=Phyllotreta striolata TaxID=444603 RepID=A0A9N9TH89_PHYSR|nr:unnamed protein product [Phyllotreta striolata]
MQNRNYIIMGRTKRKRARSKYPRILNETLIRLQLWLSENNWKNESKLKIKLFNETGRGIASKKSITPNDILISIPASSLITFAQVKISLPSATKVTIHEALAMFLIVEKMKGVKSLWSEYLQSLPEEVPLLPWLATPEEIDSYPADFKLAIDRPLSDYACFLKKACQLIGDVYEPLFPWAFAMVNTRAVYIDHDRVSTDSNSNLLLIDKPSMALCPFLDMFNHHYLAKTEAGLVEHDKKFYYELKSLNGYSKNEQIFISYGPHDNLKLLMEYGFFIPGNVYDTVRFRLEEILKELNFSLDDNRYKFIKDHNFHHNLHLGYAGVSYNLKIVLFSGYTEDMKQLNMVAFSDSYPEDFLINYLTKCTAILLNYKKNSCLKELNTLTNLNQLSNCARNVVEYIRYRLLFVEELKVIFNKNCKS